MQVGRRRSRNFMEEEHQAEKIFRMRLSRLKGSANARSLVSHACFRCITWIGVIAA